MQSDLTWPSSITICGTAQQPTIGNPPANPTLTTQVKVTNDGAAPRDLYTKLAVVVNNQQLFEPIAGSKVVYPGQPWSWQVEWPGRWNATHMITVTLYHDPQCLSGFQLYQLSQASSTHPVGPKPVVPPIIDGRTRPKKAGSPTSPTG
jgi:hypothetical protein